MRTQLYMIGLLCMLSSILCHAENDTDLIVVTKKNVEHKFVPQPQDWTNQSFIDWFKDWENETFDTFEQVKNKDGIAIDIGAWIGTTAIWLSHNFYHVVAVEPDVVSLKYLSLNLNASGCKNVSICPQPITKKSETVIFGPRWSRLNESVSYTKTVSDHEADYKVPSLTFRKLVDDYVYLNKDINTHPITFIKCDIEGGEENILEPLMHYAYYNNCKVYMSFHLAWWTQRHLKDVEYLFKYFVIDPPLHDPIVHILENPFTSILFEPKRHQGLLLSYYYHSLPDTIFFLQEDIKHYLQRKK